MVPDTTDALLAAIQSLGLLPPDHCDALPALAGRFSSPRNLADHLEHLGWLTRFECDLLLQGRGKRLLVGPYVLLERLGAGATGEVFTARERGRDHVVALKVVRPELLPNATAVQQLLWDAEAAAQLVHPNLSAILAAGSDGESIYVAMERVEGIDLGRLAHQADPFPVADARDFIRQAALGLHHAHERGILHRDVKPSNLFVTSPDDPITPERFHGATVKVLETGLTRPVSSRVLLGTLDYLAPEQVGDPAKVDLRADLYSLGCTLYHLLTSRPPFHGGTPNEKLRRHQVEEPAALTDLRPDVPADLECIVRRLLAKRPADRFTSAAELAEALRPQTRATEGRHAPVQVSPGGNPVRVAILLGAGFVLLAGLILSPMLLPPAPVVAPPVVPKAAPPELLSEDCVGVVALRPAKLLGAPVSRVWRNGVDAVLRAALPTTPGEMQLARISWDRGDLTRPVFLADGGLELPEWVRPLSDQRMARAIEGLDPEPECWFVLAADRIHRLPELPAKAGPVIRAVLDRAAVVRGSLRIGDGLVAVLHLTPRDKGRVADLERAVRAACDKSKEADGWPGEFPSAWGPIVRLLTIARVDRRGSEVFVQARLPAVAGDP